MDTTFSYFRGIRATQGLTQKALGRKIGRSQQWISLVENQKLTPSLQLRLELARALNVTDRVLFP